HRMAARAGEHTDMLAGRKPQHRASIWAVDGEGSRQRVEPAQVAPQALHPESERPFGGYFNEVNVGMARIVSLQTYPPAIATPAPLSRIGDVVASAGRKVRRAGCSRMIFGYMNA